MFIRIVGKALTLTLPRNRYGRISFQIVSPFYASTLLRTSSRDLLRFKSFAKMLLTLSQRLCTENSQPFFRYQEMIVRRVIYEMIRIDNDIALMNFQLNCVERWVKTYFRTMKCIGMYRFYAEIIEDFLSILRSMMTAEVIKFSCVLGCMPSSAVFSLIQRLPHNRAEPFVGPMRGEVHQFMCSLMQGRSPAEWKSKYNRSLCLYARPFTHLLQIAYHGTAGGGAAGGGTAGDGTAANNMDPEELQAMYE